MPGQTNCGVQAVERIEWVIVERSGSARAHESRAGGVVGGQGARASAELSAVPGEVCAAREERRLRLRGQDGRGPL